MGLLDPFGYLKQKLWSKERSGIKLAIWLSTTKSLESPWFIYVQVACHILLENSWRRIQLCKTELNRRSTKKIIGLQNRKSPNFGNFKTPNLGVPKQNDIWMLDPWPSTKNTIREKVVVSPKSGLWWILWIRFCSCLVCAPKVFQLCINQLVVYFVQFHVNNWPAFHSS
jgi:hypothetical protein